VLNFKHNFNKWVPAILWGLFISWATLKPSTYSNFNIPAWATSLHLDKWVHFGFWFIWTWLFLKKVNPTGFYICISVVFFSAYGGLIEFLQDFMNLGRTADFWDWIADTLGALIAVANMYFFKSKKRPAKASLFRY